MTKPVDITGRWIGAYCQHGHEHPISAIFAQFDTHLQGKMTDADTDFEKSVFEAALDAGLPPGADEQIVKELREQYPDAPRGPIRAASHVPEFSILEGVVQGRAVRFVKRYLGDHFFGWKIGDDYFGTTSEDHAVHYSGTIDSDGNSLEGRWWVGETRGRQKERHEGTFLLQRQDD
jgi:hypothetical protein